MNTDDSKYSTAVHEAGHGLVILMTPLREHIQGLVIWCDESGWRGEARLDQRDKDYADPEQVFDFAKSIAGLIAQLHLLPNSISADFRSIVAAEGGVLRAIKAIHANNYDIPLNCYKDFKDWLMVCAITGFQGIDYYKTEEAVFDLFRSVHSRNAIELLASNLVAKHELFADELKKFNVSCIPPLQLPAQLRYR